MKLVEIYSSPVITFPIICFFASLFSFPTNRWVMCILLNMSWSNLITGKIGVNDRVIGTDWIRSRASESHIMVE